MPRKMTVRQKIELQIARAKGEEAFLPREFRTLGRDD
jgi:hypothetical protein